MKRKIMAVILAGGMVITATACGQQVSDEPQTILVQEEGEAAYPTTTVEYGEVVKNVTLRCTYTSTDKQELSFPDDGGLIERVEVKMGDFVEAGQLLISLDVEDLEATIEEMEYQVAKKELELKQKEETKAFELASAERLFTYTKMTKADEENLAKQKESIEERYKNDLEDRRDSLKVQKQRLEAAKKELEAGRLFAAMDGEITYLENSLKNTYTVKDRVVVTVSNLDACYFATTDIEYADCFAEGDRVVVEYRDGGQKLSCEVVPALMDSWQEKLYFKPVGEELISCETDGTITMELDRKKDVLCVPEDAIHESDNGLFVYLEKDGLLEMRYVTVGLMGDDFVEIAGGLEQGEIIALKK